jgi:hypothetical protein
MSLELLKQNITKNSKLPHSDLELFSSAFSARVKHIWKLKKNKIISFEQIVDSKTVVDAMI